MLCLVPSGWHIFARNFGSWTQESVLLGPLLGTRPASSSNQRAPPPLVGPVPADRLLKPFLETNLRLPTETMYLLTIQGISEVVPWTVAHELYHRLGKG